jgi:dihydrofolate reductase
MIILGPVAVADNLVIGNQNQLPWHFPDDLKNFKKLTLGKTVVMGRKTYDSIIARLKKPLPGRKNVVITRQTDLTFPPDVLVFHSLDEAINALPSEDLYMIGGGQIFTLALPLSEIMYITHIHGNYPGDAYFPEIDWNQWEKLEEEKHEGFTFAKYKRKV